MKVKKPQFHPRWHCQIACFVWPTVQSPKISHLQWYKTEKIYLEVWNCLATLFEERLGGKGSNIKIVAYYYLVNWLIGWSTNPFSSSVHIQYKLHINSLKHFKQQYTKTPLWPPASLFCCRIFSYQAFDVQRWRITQGSMKNNINPGINDYYDNGHAAKRVIEGDWFDKVVNTYFRLSTQRSQADTVFNNT